jgi:hypothetical protein
MTASAELREAARRLLRLAGELEQDEQLRRYLLELSATDYAGVTVVDEPREVPGA